jgi:hypothetical protein
MDGNGLEMAQNRWEWFGMNGMGMAENVRIVFSPSDITKTRILVSLIDAFIGR